MKMYKFGVVLLILVMACLMAVSCQQPTPVPSIPPQGQATATATATSPPKPALPGAISYGTYGPGASSYIPAVAQANLIKKHTGINTTVEPAFGGVPQAKLLNDKKIELAMNDSYSVWLAYRGQLDFRDMGPQPFRLLMTGFEMPFSFVTTIKSGIKSVLDLKGKRVYVRMDGAPLAEAVSGSALEAYGMTYKDLAVALGYSSSGQSVTDLIEGRVDATIGSLGGAKLEDLDKSVGGFAIPIGHDQKIKDIVLRTAPPLSPVIYKAGQPCAKQDIPVYGVYQSLYTTKDVNPDLIYTVVKTLVDNYAEMATVHPQAAEFTLKRALEYQVIPYHEGAIKLYKEKGAWTDALEKKQQELLAGGK